MSVDVLEAIAEVRVVPVLTIDAAGDAAHLVAALGAGGLPVVEITLRTPSALDAIRSVAVQPGAVVGAGSVTTADSAREVIDAGARFIVSPGLDDGVIAAAHDAGVPVVPGIATPTELMRALALGATVVKLFPAETIGGIDLIRSLGAVWPQVQFVPTGGISPANAAQYLAHPQVLAVGGSWMVPRGAVAARDWAAITAGAAAAVEATRGAT